MTTFKLIILPYHHILHQLPFPLNQSSLSDDENGWPSSVLPCLFGTGPDLDSADERFHPPANGSSLLLELQIWMDGSCGVLQRQHPGAALLPKPRTHTHTDVPTAHNNSAALGGIPWTLAKRGISGLAFVCKGRSRASLLYDDWIGRHSKQVELETALLNGWWRWARGPRKAGIAKPAATEHNCDPNPKMNVQNYCFTSGLNAFIPERCLMD